MRDEFDHNIEAIEFMDGGQKQKTSKLESFEAYMNSFEKLFYPIKLLVDKYSAIWTALVAAPLRRLSATIHMFNAFSLE